MKTALVGEFNDATMVCAALAEVGKDDISGRLLFIGHFLNDKKQPCELERKRRQNIILFL